MDLVYNAGLLLNEQYKLILMAGMDKEFDTALLKHYNKALEDADLKFGLRQWSHCLTSVTVDFADYSKHSEKYTVGASVVARVTLKDGMYHEDAGFYIAKDMISKGEAIAKAKRYAIKDGIMKALRTTIKIRTPKHALSTC